MPKTQASYSFQIPNSEPTRKPRGRRGESRPRMVHQEPRDPEQCSASRLIQPPTAHGAADPETAVGPGQLPTLE